LVSKKLARSVFDPSLMWHKPKPKYASTYISHHDEAPIAVSISIGLAD
jgi:hypothetical protein